MLESGISAEAIASAIGLSAEAVKGYRSTLTDTFDDKGLSGGNLLSLLKDCFYLTF